MSFMDRKSVRKFGTKYIDPSFQSGTTDVSFKLEKDAEAILFEGMLSLISSKLGQNFLPEQEIHLYERLADQRRKHIPWHDNECGYRVYDIELTNRDYVLITGAISMAIQENVSTETISVCVSIVESWLEITEDMD